jgi:hypothetical protein
MLRRVLSMVSVYLLLAGVLVAQAGQFLDAPQYASGNSPQAVAVGDFNRDGKPDVVVVNSSSNTVSILLGNGDDTFRAKVDYITGSTPQGVVVGDFNDDGYLDLAVTNSGSNTVSVLLGNGDGTFQAKVDYATGKKPQGIAAGDFNRDGDLDLVITNAIDGTAGVLLGNGKGDFKAQVVYTTGFNPYSVAVGDFNGDGFLDFAVANNNNNNVVSVLLGRGDGTFLPQIQSSTGNTPIWLAAADLNGDGKLDLVVADQKGNSVSVLIGNGNGNFPTRVDYATAAFPTSVTFGDFNGDGYPDIAVTAGNGNAISVLLGNGDGTFRTAIDYGTGDIPYAVVAADLNGNQKLDLIVANSGGDSLSVLVGNGDGSFQTRVDYPAGTNPNSVAAGDFNGDGVLDLAVVTSNCPSYPACGPGSVSIILGNGDGTFQTPSHYSTGTNTDPYAVAVGDFSGDGKEDLAVANYATNTVGVMLGVGDGSFQAHVDYQVGSEPTSVAIADVNGDGKPDLLVSNFHSNTVSVLLGKGDGTFNSAVSYNTGNGPISVGAGDFNGDHKLDLVVVNETDNNASVFLGNGDGTFRSQVLYPTGVGGNPLSVTVGDFNGDNVLDLAVADFRTQQVSVLLGNGNGTFQAVQAYPTGANPSSVVAADFNGDGKLDLALSSTPLGSSPGNLVSLLLGNGDGTFSVPSVFGTGSQAYSLAVGDFNGSGTADLAVANGVSNTVSVLLNTQGTKMNIASSSNPSVYGQSVTFTTTVAASVSQVNAPTGTVTLKNGTTVLGSGPLMGGSFSTSTTSLPKGTDSLSAIYSGDANFQAHTVTVTQTVQGVGTATTNTALASSLNPSTVGQLITLTATVSSGLPGTPTGTVSFFDGTNQVGSSSLSGGGFATLSISTLSGGTHSLTASYSGDANFAVSTSSVLSQAVEKASSTTLLQCSSNSAALALTAKVNPGAAGTASGRVDFMDGTTQVGSSTLNGTGVAAFSTSSLTAGTHHLTAVYEGDSNFNASTSSVVSVAADFILSASTLSPSSVSPGQSATSTVTIAPSNGFNSAGVMLTCSLAPAVSPAPTCVIGSISVEHGTGTASATISTVAPSAALAQNVGTHSSGMLLMFGLVVLAIFMGVSVRVAAQRTKLASFAVIFLLLGLCFFEVACGGSGNMSIGNGQTGMPAGAYRVTITGSANGVQHNTSVNLSVN